MSELKTMLNDINTIYQLSYYIIYYKNLEQKDKIEECKNRIQSTYNKYNIKNINELVLIIEGYVKNIEIIKDEELIRLLLYVILDSKKRKVLEYNDEIFKNIYKYIIENGLFDPNWIIGTSSEPLFTMLPNSSDLYSVNMLVFNNESIDWNILNNGTDSFISFVYSYLNSSSYIEKSYYLEIIKSAIDRVDFDSIKRYKTSQKKVCYEVISISEKLKQLSDNNPSINPILDLVVQKVKTNNRKV